MQDDTQEDSYIGGVQLNRVVSGHLLDAVQGPPINHELAQGSLVAFLTSQTKLT